MPSTMDLLETALAIKSSADWHRQLNLARNTLNTAKIRGNLSPSIAGALAQELGQDPEKWIVIAALESDRESACKTRMVQWLKATTKSPKKSAKSGGGQGGSGHNQPFPLPGK